MRGFLISESKKSEAVEKLNRALPFLEKYTDKILDLDPTGYKYVGWIANNLIDYFKGKNEVSSEDWIYLNNFLGSIKSFHNNQQYIDKEVLKRFKNALTWANDEVANKNVDNFELVKINDSIRNHSIEICGAELRAAMTASRVSRSCDI